MLLDRYGLPWLFAEEPLQSVVSPIFQLVNLIHRIFKIWKDGWEIN
jgi:hypothetical protein